MLKLNIKLLIDPPPKMTMAHLSPSVDRDRRPCYYCEVLWSETVVLWQNQSQTSGIKTQGVGFFYSLCRYTVKRWLQRALIVISTALYCCRENSGGGIFFYSLCRYTGGVIITVIITLCFCLISWFQLLVCCEWLWSETEVLWQNPSQTSDSLGLGLGLNIVSCFQRWCCFLQIILMMIA